MKRSPETGSLKKAVVRVPLIVLFLLVLVFSQAFAQNKGTITLLIGASNSYRVSEAIADIAKIPEAADGYSFHYYTNEDLKDGKVDHDVVAQSKIIVVNDMHREWRDYLLKNIDFEKIKVYGLSSVPKEPEKIISDPKVQTISGPVNSGEYQEPPSFSSKSRLRPRYQLRRAATHSKNRIFHPESDKIFKSFKAYLSWYKEKGFYNEDGFWVGGARFWQLCLSRRGRRDCPVRS